MSANQQVTCWIEQCVLGLSLCPYARQPYDQGAVVIVTCACAEEFLESIDGQARALLAGTDETVLVALENGLSDFLDFNDFLDDVEQRLQELEFDDRLQIASFHPAYLFAGEAPSAPSNYTNRAPLPIVQLLRVESVSKAVDGGDTMAIPDKNMLTLRALEAHALHRLFPWVEG